MKTILVPTDFSENAHIGLNTAINLARHTQAKVLVLHVLEPPRITKSAHESVFSDKELEGKYMKYLQDIADMKLKGELEKLHCDVTIEHEALLGNLFEILPKYLAQDRVAFVVSGTHFVKGWEEHWEESNTGRLVRFAPCPVLAVKQAIENLPIQKLVFATDLRHVEERTIQHLRYFQDTYAAELHVLHINTSFSFHTSRQVRDLYQKFQAKAQLKIAAFCSYAADNVEEGIVHYMEDERADVLALETRQRTGMVRWLSGSVAENLVNHAPFPVLTFGLKHSQ